MLLCLRIYTNNNNSSTPGNFTVIETDPSNNQTVHNFWSEYQTEAIAYQGGCTGYSSCNGGGTKLRDVTTCYNGNLNNGLSGCQTPTSVLGSRVSQTDVYTTMYTPTGGTTQSLVETKVDVFGNVTETSNSAWGPTIPPSGTPLSSTTLTYDYSGSASCGTLSIAYIYNRPCSATTAKLGNTASQSTFIYNPAGHPIQTSFLVTGTTYLTSQFSYNASNGTLATSTDVNGAITNYYYNGTGGCNNLLLTSITLPVNGLAASQQWNCSGGVLTSSTDPNGQVSTFGYVNQPPSSSPDPLWRLLSVTDPLGNVTWNTYSPGGTVPVTLETYLNFPISSPTSTVDTLSTFDGLGRLVKSQKRTAPGATTFDNTIQYTYGWSSSGAFSQQTVPGGTALTTNQLDALGRTASLTDGGGGTLNMTYAQNDVLRSVGPPPTGENAKRKQLEYDALGRVTSVCELTSTLSGYGTCNQLSSTPNGYFTTYTYDSPTNSIAVSQNAQGTPQGRTYQFDGLGRLTSETNPEWTTQGTTATASYTYDSDPSGKCPSPYNGDLVKRVDNAGNTTCYTYDALHRQLSSTYSGPNSTTNRYFVYDAANVNGQTMTYPLGKMVEAYTATCSTCSKATDEGFSYDQRGELSEFYESTANSVGYYSVPISHWANGLPETFGPFLSEGQINITPDGEGRPQNITGGAQNITYTAASQPWTLQTSCAGSTCYPISYTYDPSTLRMTQYSAALSTGTVSGNLTWNPNGSLQKLIIADPKNSANAQTCNYSADDLARISSVSCNSGTTWGQQFSYDAFGNITKTVPAGATGTSWIPGYYSSTNHYSLGGTSYDSDGNLLNDSLGHTYTWDAEGKQLSGGSFGFTYDASGHLVELSVSGNYSRSYVPLGKFKLSATGQTANYSETPLPGGSVASQNGGATGVQLADWLGTIRALYSYTEGTEGASGAHAPFGEAYADDSVYAQGFTGQGGPGWGNGSDGNVPSTVYWFPERQYSSGQGRWLSPDPAGLNAVDFSNPQTWNRYAYVMNNPLSNIDPGGLDCISMTSVGPSISPGQCSSGSDAYVPGVVTGILPGTQPGSYGYWFQPYSGDDLGKGVIDPNTAPPSDLAWLIYSGSGNCGAMEGCPPPPTPLPCQFGAFHMKFCQWKFPQPLNNFPTISATHWYKNPCIQRALAKGAATAGLDAIGLLPEGGAIAGAFSLFHGAAGVSNGTNILGRVAMGGALISTASSLSDSSGPSSAASTQVAYLQAGVNVFGIVKSFSEAIPVAGQVIAGVSVGLDLVSTGLEIAECQ